MRRVIGIDIHRTFGEVVIWDSGVLRHAGRIDMTRTGLEGLGKGLKPTDEVVIEATGNCMAVARVLSPFVARVVIANPLQVKAIAHAHVKTDKVDAGTLASLHAAGFLPRQDADHLSHSVPERRKLGHGCPAVCRILAGGRGERKDCSREISEKRLWNWDRTKLSPVRHPVAFGLS